MRQPRAWRLGGLVCLVALYSACGEQTRPPGENVNAGAGGTGTSNATSTGGTGVGGSTAGSEPSASSSAGATTSGGTSAASVTTSGGTSSVGVTTNRGGSSATVATTCVADNVCPSEGVFMGDFAGSRLRGCGSDSVCLAGESCYSVGAHRCTCGPSSYQLNGKLYYTIVYDVQVRACQPSRCTNPVSLAFTSQLGSSPCDVVVRVNADASAILAYKVVCGAAGTVTQDALLSTLQSTSGAAWQGAIAYGDTSKHFLFVDDSDPNHAIAFSGVTGLQLFEFSDATTPTVLGDWSNASELDGSCDDGSGFNALPHYTLGPWQESYPWSSVVSQVVQQGVFSGMSTASGGERSVTLVHAGLPTEEFFVIISTSPRT